MASDVAALERPRMWYRRALDTKCCISSDRGTTVHVLSDQRSNLCCSICLHFLPEHTSYQFFKGTTSLRFLINYVRLAGRPENLFRWACHLRSALFAAAKSIFYSSIRRRSKPIDSWSRLVQGVVPQPTGAIGGR